MVARIYSFIANFYYNKNLYCFMTFRTIFLYMQSDVISFYTIIISNQRFTA